MLIENNNRKWSYTDFLCPVTHVKVKDIQSSVFPQVWQLVYSSVQENYSPFGSWEFGVYRHLPNYNIQLLL